MSKGMEMMMRGFGIGPEFMQQAQAFVEGMHQTFQQMKDTQHNIDVTLLAMQEQLIRIEGNTIVLMEGMDGTAPAGPTNYELHPAMPQLPPMEHERIQDA